MREGAFGQYCRSADTVVISLGFGTYTAVDIPAAKLRIVSSMPAIPAIKTGNEHWPGSDYVWSGHGFDADHSSPYFETAILAVMFGSLANAHTGITNLMQNSGVYHPVLDRREDPGAGASSDHIEYYFYSQYPVKAGEELFVSYGEQW